MVISGGRQGVGEEERAVEAEVEDVGGMRGVGETRMSSVGEKAGFERGRTM
jgi:hypothetical protein